MSAIFTKHLDAIEVSCRLTLAQVAAARHAIASVEPKAVTPLPERCTGIPAEACALQSRDARVAMGSFANPHAWRCGGCGYDSGSDAVT